MGPQLGHDGLVVPLAAADKELDRLAGQSGLDGDRLAGLSLHAAQETTDDQGGVVTLLDAVEARKVPLEEARHAVGTVTDRVGGDDGVVQEGLSLGMIQERHDGVPVR